MTYGLAETLSSFSTLAGMIAIAVFGLACHRHRKGGGDKSFGITAWITLFCLLFICIPFTVVWAERALASSGSPTAGPMFFMVLGHCQSIADALWFALFVTFTVGVWRTVKKLPSRVPESAPEGDAARPSD